MAKKWVYFFGNGKADGNGKMKDVLGGKGAGLAEMTNSGVPVPPGFTISTEACNFFYDNRKKLSKEIIEQVDKNLARLEKVMNKKLGGKNDPLLVSVRSGSKFSMPGMMDTVLNLGLNDDSVKGLTEKTGNERFSYDAYRRFNQMFGNVVMGVDKEHFEHHMTEMKNKKGIKLDTELNTADLKQLVEMYKKAYQEQTGQTFPTDPKKQLAMTRDAVFNSWNSPRAITYRRIHNIDHNLGTAVNVQAMVFGNMGNDSATGVGFTRNPPTGEKVFYGEYLINAQGEDVVAGIRMPNPITHLEKDMPEAFKQLKAITSRLEKHYCDVQDFEFTIGKNKLYMLQTRNDNDLDAFPCVASGQVVFTAKDAVNWAKTNKTLLVGMETSPDDIYEIAVSEGILINRGSAKNRAVVVSINPNYDNVKVSVTFEKQAIDSSIDPKARKILSSGVDARKLSKDILDYNDKKISKTKKPGINKSKDKKSSDPYRIINNTVINGNCNKISTDRIGNHGYSSENCKKSNGNLFTKTVKFIKSIKKTIHLLF